jgi:hypothetical protein
MVGVVVPPERMHGFDSESSGFFAVTGEPENSGR